MSNESNECKRCKRELPFNDEYFPKDKTTKSGLRNVCYECNPKYTHRGFGKRRVRQNWTEEETELFIKVYPHYMNKELVEKFFPNRNEKSLMDKANKMNIVKSDETRDYRYEKHSELMSTESVFIGRKLSEEEKKRISEFQKKRWEEDYEGMKSLLSYERDEEYRKYMSELKKEQGQWKGENNPQYKVNKSGSANPNWKGGITDLYFWCRNNIGDWKQNSMIDCNYRCVITGDYFDEIHHLTNFRKIVDEVLMDLNYQDKCKIDNFSDEELDNLRNHLIIKNEFYGLGVCLKKSVHKKFHEIYGYHNNTPEQFEEFKNDYLNGKYS